MAEEGEGKLWQRARNGDRSVFDVLQRELEAAGIESEDAEDDEETERG